MLDLFLLTLVRLKCWRHMLFAKNSACLPIQSETGKATNLHRSHPDGSLRNTRADVCDICRIKNMQETGHLLFSSSRKKTLFIYKLLALTSLLSSTTKLLDCCLKPRPSFCVSDLLGSVIPPLRHGHLLLQDKSYTPEINRD